jgi:phosphate transport system substrate-binding protein
MFQQTEPVALFPNLNHPWDVIRGFSVRMGVIAILFTLTVGERVDGQNSVKPVSQTEVVRPVESAEQAAAEKVMSMLMAIDPYCPMEECKGQLSVFGTPTMGALVNQWSEGFKRFHPSVSIEISEMKGPPALNYLAQNPQGVAMIARPLTENELESLKQSGLKTPMQVEVGMQALGVFVNAANPLKTINQEQFLKVFAHSPNQELAAEESGENQQPQTVTWGELGLAGDWSSKPVHLVYRESTSGTHSFLKNQLLGQHKLRQPKETYNSSMEVLQAISSDPQAIGISNLRSSITDAQALTLQDGKSEIPCNDLAILNGEYPLVRKITLVFDAGGGAANLAAREFVKYAMGQNGQRETVLSGFFPLDPPLLRAQTHKIDSLE